MPSYRRPGVFFDETISQAEAVTGANLTAAAFLGANYRGPTTPQYITSWSQYLTYFGGFGTDPTQYLPYAVYEFFANGGREAYVARAVSVATAPVTATVSLTDRAGTPLATLRVDAANPGNWGGGANSVAGRDGLYIDITDSGTDRFNLIVKLGGTADVNIVERWIDLSMDPTSGRYALSLINSPSSGSPYIRVADLGSATAAPANRPAVQANAALASGTPGATVGAGDLSAALPVFDAVDRPLTMNLPGHSGAAVTDAINYAAGRGDVFVVVDPPMGAPPDATSTGILTVAPGFGSSSYGAIYYPWLQMADPASQAAGAMRLLPPGGAVIGQYASTDVTRGVFKTPAGVNNRIAGAIGVERKLTGAQLDALNPIGINAIRQLPGAGIVIMGGRTLKPTGSDKYVAARRTLIYLRSSLLTSTRFAIFEPNDANLWSTLRSIIERFLLDFWQTGGLRGTSAAEAFYVKCDDENNSPQTISSGEVHVEIGVALQYPAEFIVFRLSQREVGATVTVTT